MKSPARGSLVSGVATRRRLCSLTGPIHWPWLQPQEAQGHCSVSEVMAGRTKSSRAGGGRERLPRRAGQESLSGLLGYVTTALSRLGTFDSHLNWGPIRFRLESSPSRCFHGASPPLQPPPWAPPTLGLWALDSRRSPRGSVAVHLGLGPVPFFQPGWKVGLVRCTLTWPRATGHSDTGFSCKSELGSLSYDLENKSVYLMVMEDCVSIAPFSSL